MNGPILWGRFQLPICAYRLIVKYMPFSLCVSIVEVQFGDGQVSFWYLLQRLYGTSS
jgi:hypothetical protein